MKKILFSCGGTGGHIYPAIAIASEIKKRQPDAGILFIGTKGGMENRLVPGAGFEIRGIDASGFHRRELLKNFRTLSDAIKGSREAAQIIREFKPDIAIGTGGYVTGTVIMQARKQGIPCYIHEQNAVPGLTNKLLEHYADTVFISFAESAGCFRHPTKTFLTGNPIRGQFEQFDAADCRRQLGLAEEEAFVLVFGGSLGAGVLNEATLSLLKALPPKGIRLCFVTGKRYYEQIKSRIDTEGLATEALQLLDYADNMPVLMKAADLVISRAGAIAVSEILACAKPSILVPSPNVTNNHQYHNAKAIADRNAAVLVQEKDMAGGYDGFVKTVLELASDAQKRKNMAACAASLARTDAAQLICSRIGLD